MKVVCDTSDLFPAVPLASVKSGRVVCFFDLDENPAFYQVAKLTALESEAITVPHDKRLLVNMETGRVVLKSSSLQVYLTSCTASAYPTPQ